MPVPAMNNDTASTNLTAALRLAEAGLHVFPVQADKKPLPGFPWRALATNNPAKVRDDWRRNADALPAIDCSRSGLVVMDLDRHGGPDGVQAFAGLVAGQTFDPARVPTVLTPGGGRHLFFRQSDGQTYGNVRGALPAGIDVRGDGGYVVAIGATLPDGRGYRRAEGTPDLADAFRAQTIPGLPDWLAAILRERRDNRVTATQDAMPAPAPVPPASGDARQEVSLARREAYARAALEKRAGELARAQPGERNNALNDATYRMGRMIEAGWIDRATVGDALWAAARTCGLVGDDGEDAVQATMASGLVAGGKAGAPELADRPTPARDGAAVAAGSGMGEAAITLYWHGEPDPFGDQLWLVKGMIQAVGTGLLSGQSGSGKTFVGLDLAASIMTGRPFAGRPVKNQGGVLFLAAEGAAQVNVRLRALVGGTLADPFGEPPGNLPFAWSDRIPPILSGRGEDMAAVEAVIAAARATNERLAGTHGLPLRLIIIDTIAAAAGFQDENSAAETQALFRALSAIANELGVMVLGIDHFGKAVETGTRGSSAKEAAADCVLACLADKGITGSVSGRRLALRKVRGGPQGDEFPFHLVPIELGTDDDGEAVTSCTVSWAKPTSFMQEREAPWRRSLFTLRCALTNALASHGEDAWPFGSDGPKVKATTRQRLRNEFNRLHIPDDDDDDDPDAAKRKNETTRKALTRALKAARERNLIGFANTGARELVWFIALHGGIEAGQAVSEGAGGRDGGTDRDTP